MEIQLASIKDAASIQKIYCYYVENTNISFEYEAPTVSEMEKRIQNTLSLYPYLIAKEDNKVIGYAYASAFHSRSAYQWGVELSIYVDEYYHGKHVASSLYEALFKILQKMNNINVYACIVHPNVKSENFHHRLGFQDIGIYRKSGYKFNQWHDVIWMQKTIGDYDHVQPIRYMQELSNEEIELCL